MKKAIISAILFCCASALFGQINVIKNNILYLGIPNPISISFCNYTKYQIIVRAEKGIIRPSNFGDFEYFYDGKNFGDDTITVTRKSDSTEIFWQTFRLKEIPNPIINLPKAKNGVISKQDIINAKVLFAGLDFDYAVHFRIDSVRILIVKSNKLNRIMTSNIGSDINEKTLKEFKKLNAGDIIIFEAAFVTGPWDKVSRKLPPSTILIKD